MITYYILLIVIILQFAYIVYQDYMNRQEREKMQLKIMSKDVIEYKDAINQKQDEDMDEDDDEITMDIEDMDTETLLKAIDKT